MHKLRTGHLFAGAGGGILADLLLGHQPIFAVEIEDYPRKVLEQRQADGILPFFPTFGDIKEFDGKPWRGKVDVVCGGFPCQDISSCGRGAGIDGSRSGLWGEMRRIISEIQPKRVFVENSPLLVGRGLARVLGDLAEMGYDARWCVLGADTIGGGHRRNRMWILADTHGPGQSKPRGFHVRVDKAATEDRKADWFQRILQGRTMPYVCREADGMADSMDRLKAIGNGQDSRVAATAFKLLSA